MDVSTYYLLKSIQQLTELTGYGPYGTTLSNYALSSVKMAPT